MCILDTDAHKDVRKDIRTDFRTDLPQDVRANLGDTCSIALRACALTGPPSGPVSGAGVIRSLSPGAVAGPGDRGSLSKEGVREEFSVFCKVRSELLRPILDLLDPGLR